MVTAARMTRQEAEDFLYEEARLIDERRFEEWRDFFIKLTCPGSRIHDARITRMKRQSYIVYDGAGSPIGTGGETDMVCRGLAWEVDRG